MWMFGFPEMLDIHVSEENLKKINDNEVRRIVFDNVLLGQNLMSIEMIDKVANFVCKQSIEHLKEVTINEIEENTGQIYDTSGYLH